jgi:hypothetical protein
MASFKVCSGYIIIWGIELSGTHPASERVNALLRKICLQAVSVNKVCHRMKLMSVTL